MKMIVFLAGLALFAQGCTYAISSDMARKADKTVSFKMVLAEPETFKGKIVILGGAIAQIKNGKQGTLIEVVQKELDYWGKPRRTERSGGRFILLHPRYLDALVYAPGREITAAAEVTGTEEKSLSNGEYTYPLLIPKEMKLWEKVRYQSQPRWWDPLYDPYGSERREL